MNLQVETLPNYRIAYVRRVGAYGRGNNEVMEEIKQWATCHCARYSKTYAEILLTIQNNGYQIDNKPIMERYTSVNGVGI